MKTYIKSDPEILGGKPIIRGTRIPVARILHLLSDGYMVENIAEQYPQVDAKILRGVIAELISNLDKSNHAPQVP